SDKTEAGPPAPTVSSPYQRQLQVYDRLDLTNRVHQAIEKEFGVTGRDVVGRGMSTPVFLPKLPKVGETTAIGIFNERLQKSYNSLEETEYLKTEPETGNELWRISIRLGALNDIDYGQFVHRFKSAVEPILSAYRYREKIYEKVYSANKDRNKHDSLRILLLGASYKSAKGEAKKRPTLESPVDQDHLFAHTLYEILKHNRHYVKAHDPRFYPLDGDVITGLSPQEEFQKDYKPKAHNNWKNRFASEQSLDDYLSKQEYDLIVFLDDQPYQSFLQTIQKQESQIVTIPSEDYHYNVANPAETPTASQRMANGEKGAAIKAIYTGVVPVVYKAQRTLLKSLIESIGLAFVLIAIVMVLLLRSPRAGLVSMIPNVFPVVVIFGFMGYFGIQVDIGSMMTASVAMGVAVDDTIHFLAWFRKGLDRGLSHKKAVTAAYRRVAIAMSQTTAIAGLGLAVFALSTFTPTQRFGTLMLSLLLIALIGDLIFLPAILASPLGRVFKKTKRSLSEEKSEFHNEEDNLQTTLKLTTFPSEEPCKNKGTGPPTSASR
ncbi:MAG: efflux RND transporter permease subunit, partial [Pirellulaceae bacterium]|nr:efflux RND transporter permease subunit [Pirellulaceae bacterium]